jgi:hypothetical protein
MVLVFTLRHVLAINCVACEVSMLAVTSVVEDDDSRFASIYSMM